MPNYAIGGLLGLFSIVTMQLSVLEVYQTPNEVAICSVFLQCMYLQVNIPLCLAVTQLSMMTSMHRLLTNYHVAVGVALLDV